ncbi:hypothetical protein RCL1_006681 [Eukaryota sp. TZLM3-RCL]
MGYCSNGDLYKYLKSRRSNYLPEEQILDWFIQLCLALQYCHSKHILHRDIKTQNVFLTDNNVAKLGDFGIAKVLSSTIDVAKSVVGSPLYMSPEILDHRPYNAKSDVWSLGCVLYEMSTMKHAFDAENMNNLIFKIIRGKYPPPPSHYSIELVNLIRQMLSKDPALRPSVNQILRLPFIRKRMQNTIHSEPVPTEQPVPRSLSPRISPRVDPGGLGVVGRPISARKQAQMLEEARQNKGQAENLIKKLEEERKKRREWAQNHQKLINDNYKVAFAAGSAPGVQRVVKVPISTPPQRHVVPPRREHSPIKSHVPIEEVVQRNASVNAKINQKLRRLHESWERKKGKIEPPQDLNKIREEERKKEEEKRRRNREIEEAELLRLERQEEKSEEERVNNQDDEIVDFDLSDSEIEQEANNLLMSSIQLINQLESINSIIDENRNVPVNISIELLRNALKSPEISESEEDSVLIDESQENSTDSFTVYNVPAGLVEQLSALRQRVEKELGSDDFDRLYLIARNVVDDESVSPDLKYKFAEDAVLKVVGSQRKVEARLLLQVLLLEDACYDQ